MALEGARFMPFWIGLLGIVLMVSGCAALRPVPKTMAERLDAFPRDRLPLERVVTIRWNRFQVPFVEAETDRDLAFALGMVHAHLRLAEIRILKQLVQGRASEMVGPIARNIDHALKIMEIGRAAPEMVRQLPETERTLLESFAAGLNLYQSRLNELPPEFSLLGLVPEPFTVEQLVSIGRLGSVDINWLVYLGLLRLRERPDFPRIWARALEVGSGPVVSFPARGEAGALEQIVLSTARSGSNAVVVAPDKSANGSALIAGDPHLGMGVPNLWLLAGMRSPSFTGVGFMVPGLPFIAEGRSFDLAWVGTNIRSANSEFYDISKVDDAGIETRSVGIKQRFWFPTTREVRASRFGPIVSDSSVVPSRNGETIALKWIGHQPTDEIGSLFGVMRSRNAGEFRAALEDFAVSPQNFLCADTEGNICHVLATMLPKRAAMKPAAPVLDASDPANEWTELADSATLPFALNPPEGFLASANNKPTDTPFPIGYFFSSDERVRRLQQFISERPKVSLDDLKRLQRDTLSLDSRDLAASLVRLIETEPDAAAAAPAFVAELKAFDGDYRVDARGPVVYETLLYHLVPAVYGAASADALVGPYSDLRQLKRYLFSDIDALPRARRREILISAVKSAARDSAKFATWGDMHRLRVQHWLAPLPVLGRNFVYGDYPSGGSRETLMKTAHGLINGVTISTFGSQARFVSDMGDPDSSEFVLIGGNDGWLGSENALDQVPLWLKGEYIRMPLRPETVAREFPVLTVLGR
jgi:penicillin amidase